MRSCASGYWRFFPSRGDLLTPGYHYFADTDTRYIEAPHSFGSAVWQKDGMVYPVFPTGQLMSAGVQWYNGQAPEPLPPDQILFPLTDFGQDLPYPPSPSPDFRNGFDHRCFIVGHPGVDIPIDDYLKPDVTDCCWQRVLARMLELLTEPFPNALVDFNNACTLLWPGYTVQIFPLSTTVDRIAWIVGPTWQLILRVGTQIWQEIMAQAFHLSQPPHDYGAFATSQDWFNRSTELLNHLNAFAFDPNKPMVFVGHSRGAVVLWILARRLLQANPFRSIDFLSFGIPKVGDERMTSADNYRIARHVIHRLDPVPLLPPGEFAILFLGGVLSLPALAIFLLWKKFSVYQITGIPGGPAFENGGEVPLTFLIAWITELLTNQPMDPIPFHYLGAYVAALADCCDEPRFPFTIPFWQQLFFGVVPAFGGLRIDGAGVNPAAAGAGGLKLGGGLPFVIGDGGLQIGGGALVGLRGRGGLQIGGGSPAAAGAGGLEIGGAGVLVYVGHFILTETAFYILQESGDKIERE